MNEDQLMPDCFFFAVASMFKNKLIQLDINSDSFKVIDGRNYNSEEPPFYLAFQDDKYFLVEYRE